MAKPIRVSFQVREEDDKDLFNFLSDMPEPKAPSYRQLMIDGMLYRATKSTDTVMSEVDLLSQGDLYKGIDLQKLKELILPLILSDIQKMGSVPIAVSSLNTLDSSDSTTSSEVVPVENEEEELGLLDNLLNNFTL